MDTHHTGWPLVVSVDRERVELKEAGDADTGLLGADLQGLRVDGVPVDEIGVPVGVGSLGSISPLGGAVVSE